jgi:hypothetical protein
MAEIGGLGARGMVVDHLRIAREDQHRREIGRHEKHPTESKMAEVELIELSRFRERREPNPKGGLRCMVFGQDNLLPNISNAQNTIFLPSC